MAEQFNDFECIFRFKDPIDVGDIVTTRSKLIDAINDPAFETMIGDLTVTRRTPTATSAAKAASASAGSSRSAPPSPGGASFFARTLPMRSGQGRPPRKESRDRRPSRLRDSRRLRVVPSEPSALP
jgi:hypothetical protein